MDWEQLKNDIPRMRELADQYGIRGLARKVGVKHPAIIYHLNKNTEKKIDNGDSWIVEYKNREFEISKKQIKQVRKDYCGSNLTIDEVCSKNNLPEWKFTAIKNVFNIKHSSPIWTEQELMENDPKELAELATLQQKDLYFNEKQGKQLKYYKKQLQKYWDKEYWFDKADKAIQEFWSNYDGELPEFDVKEIDDEFVLEINIPDLHLARLCWKAEVGENYDRKKAVKRFMKILKEIINRVKVKIDKIIFPLGHDFTNFDNIDGETTNGTFQDNDSRWQKMIITAQELAVTAIELMKKEADIVEVILIQGNHDFVTSFHIVRYLKAYYKNDDRVEIDDSPKLRKYRLIGINLIGYSHGDKEGKNIYDIMHNEVPKLWGKSKYREFHLGHIHTREVREKNGVIFRWIPAAAAKSSWEYNKAFTSMAGSKGYLYHRNKGLYNTIPIDLF